MVCAHQVDFSNVDLGHVRRIETEIFLSVRPAVVFYLLNNIWREPNADIF